MNKISRFSAGGSQFYAGKGLDSWCKKVIFPENLAIFGGCFGKHPKNQRLDPPRI